MSLKPSGGNLAGTRIPLTAPGGGARILSRKLQNLVLAFINAFSNIKIVQPYSDGTAVVNSKEADVKITNLRAVITLPPVPLSGSAGTSANVPYSGLGPPSSTTLSPGINYLASPVPSLYVDRSAIALYVCTTAGTSLTSVWTQISGGQGIEEYDNTHAYPSGSRVWVSNVTVIAGVTIVPGVYEVTKGNTVPANGIGNQIPQWPEPTSGTVYWYMTAFGRTLVNTCQGGAGAIYGNFSGTL